MTNRQLYTIIKRFLVFVPVAAFFFYFYGQLIELEQENAKMQIVNEHTGHLNLIDYTILNAFEEYRATLLLMRNAGEMINYVEDPSETHQEEVEQLFVRIANNRPYIKQVMLLGSQGEVQTCTESFLYPPAVSDDSLIFPWIWEQVRDATSRMGPYDFYFSEITSVSFDDTTMQIIATAMPIMHAGESARTMIMLVDASHLLSMVEQLLANHANSVFEGVVDSKGRWVLRIDGGMASATDLSELALAQSNPGLWEEIVLKNEGSYWKDGMNYYFTSFDPFFNSALLYESRPHFLVGIISFHDSAIPILKGTFLLQHESLQWVFSLLIIGLGGAINLLAHLRKNDKELLTVGNLVSEQSHDGVVIIDAMMHVTYCNHAFELMTGFSRKDVLAHGYQMISLQGRTIDCPTMQEAVNRLGVHESWDGSVWLVGKTHYRLMHMHIRLVFNDHGQLVYSVILYSNPHNIANASFLALLEEQDVVVGQADTYPRMVFDERKRLNAPFSIAYLKIMDRDLAKTKVNWEQLYRLDVLVRQHIADAVGENGLLIQYTADTYVISLFVGKEALLQSAFQEPLVVDGKSLMFSIRCGISRSSQEVSDTLSMMNQARMALAALEHYEQNGVLVYDDTVNEQLMRYYAILRSFEEAIQRKDIQVYYQPVVEVLSNRIRGAEALARWTHPRLGVIFPAEFVPIIEQNHLERLLDRYVLQKTIAFLKQLSLQKEQQFTISINLCPTELQDPHLVSELVKELDGACISHSRLAVELTERSLMADFDTANTVLAQLRKEGIRVIIDDFGSGFSSLSYLHDLEVDTLKIDCSFIKRYPQTDDGTILKALLSMTRELGIKAVVEGVETEKQLQFLKSIGVSFYQGFLFSPAIDEESFMELLCRSSETRDQHVSYRSLENS